MQSRPPLSWQFLGVALFSPLALTGYGQPGDRERARLAGFDGHLVKPVAVEVLHQVLARGGAAAKVS